jgi:diguanylate cyclase (GGDEF)-like protein
MRGRRGRDIIGLVRLRPQQAVRLLVALSALVTCGMLGFGAAVLLDAREDAWQQAHKAAENLVVTMERDIARNVDLFDLSLKGVIQAMRQPGFEGASPEVRHMAMFGRSAMAEYLGSVLVTDRDGNMLANSLDPNPKPVDLADRELFYAHRDRADAGLWISLPVASKMRGGDLVIAVSRRIPGPGGQFQGVVSGAMRAAYFKEMFAKLDLGTSGSVTLFRDDGRILMRRPFRDIDLGADLSSRPTFRRLLEAPSGSFTDRAALDGVMRLYTYRRVANLPLILTLNLSLDDIYAAWNRKALGIGIALAVLCTMTMALTLLVRAELLRRLAAETALQNAAARLELLAATDPLTGLANRRSFEQALEREWLRAARNGSHIAVMMIDADSFKLYNDRYGHQAGDNVLRDLARCIEAHARRPADTCARYGGEEFIVLLPETDVHGAVIVAEAIRGAFEGLGIPHAGSAHGIATLSAGVADHHPAAGESPETLVRQADEALYAAKSHGRNRVQRPQRGERPGPAPAVGMPQRIRG